MVSFATTSLDLSGVIFPSIRLAIVTLAQRGSAKQCYIPLAGLEAGAKAHEEILEPIIQPHDLAWSRWLRLSVYIVCGIAFLVDVFTDAALAFGVFYIPLVSTAIYYRNTWAPWWLATLATAMVAVGFFVPSINPDIFHQVAEPRYYSIIAYLPDSMASSGNERRIRDQLAVIQTVRAGSGGSGQDSSCSITFGFHELRTPLAGYLLGSR